MNSAVIRSVLQDRPVNETVDELFTTYEPFLRAVVRRNTPGQFRGQFDSVDVVQSVWVYVLQGLRSSGWWVNEPARFRALLRMLARRRLISRVRHYRAAAEREQRRAASHAEINFGQPRPSELAQANELWDRLLELCPPAHHNVLRLRRNGLSLNEIADQTGLHEGSVRRVLRHLARRLAVESIAPDCPRSDLTRGCDGDT
jgi:RNA polymerase sigma factor (sigma-70 family)